MPATFSVPGLRPRSCRPPKNIGLRRTLRRTNSAPVPCGAYILWPEMLRRSQPSAATSSASLPAACTASVWNSAPAACALSASSRTGWIAPVSLLASITLTSFVPSSGAVLGRSAASSAATSTMPSGVQGRKVTSTPRCASSSAACSTAWCSMLLVIRWSPGASRPNSAILSLSVPPEVKTISAARQFSNPATDARARSTAARARWPCWWMELALPNSSVQNGRIASSTSGSTGVVALASM